MKFGANIVIFSTVLAIAYGVLFSYTYPLVDVTSGIVSLCALSGLVTCLAITALWRAVMGGKGA